MKTPVTAPLRGALLVLSACLMFSVAQAEDSAPKEKKPLSEAMKKYDTNNDGVVDPTERKAAAEAKRLEKFDANKDGKLDESELAAEKAEKAERAEKAAKKKAEKKAPDAPAPAGENPGM